MECKLDRPGIVDYPVEAQVITKKVMGGPATASEAPWLQGAGLEILERGADGAVAG